MLPTVAVVNRINKAFYFLKQINVTLWFFWRP